MPLAPAVRLGPYQIESMLGAGGMGEVYRARDTRLERTVAVKVLAIESGAPGPRLERFRREARAISRLSHPHICALLDVGEQDGRAYLVMEHLEGETLAERLSGGRLPLERALRHGIQIAVALDAAHREGVVHRDLKPANVMLTRDGVKLLDFGLARLRPGADDALLDGDTATLTTENTVLGTAPYMAPEHLDGRETDGRADIFALGVVLFEMVCGRRPFVGDSKARIMAAILEQEAPPISGMQPLAPPVLDHVVQRCLAKDPDERWQTARDVAIALEWVLEGGSAAGLPPPVAKRRDLRRVGGAVLAGLAAGAALAAPVAWRLARPRPAPPRPALRLSLSLDPPALVAGSQRSLALSPDGSRLAYVTGSREDHRLAVRVLSQPQSVVMPWTEGAVHPFFSPDGQWIAFFAGRALKKVPAAGGTAITLCPAPDVGGSWGPDGTIVFSGGPGRGLQRVSEDGGAPTDFVPLDAAAGERAHSYPFFLPGGGAVLFTVTTLRHLGGNHTVVHDLATGTRRTLVSGYDARYLPSGHLVFTRGRNVMAARFDLARRELKGPATPMIEDLAGYMLYPVAQFDVAGSGSIVYAPTTVFVPRRLQWVGRDGTAREVGLAPGLYEDPRLSHGGRQLAVEIDADIWLVDLARSALSRLTFAPEENETPVWSPDDRRVAYSCHYRQGGDTSICWRAADGSGDEEVLFSRPSYVSLGAFAPDGRALLFIDNAVETGHDIGIFRFDDRRRPEPLLNSRFNERAPAVSPDGRWLAYSSDETGRREVFVQAFPGLGAKQQVSTDGGDEPLWSRDGREVFYRRGLEVRAVAVHGAHDLKVGAPRTLFAGRYVSFPQRPESQYDVGADGRFLMMQREGPADPPLVMVVDWAEELKARLPMTAAP
ncbi:MAG TPA: protein kinase [Vicinamibacteria bacterium]|jgi:serine/threonine-protein kinase